MLAPVGLELLVPEPEPEPRGLELPVQVQVRPRQVQAPREWSRSQPAPHHPRDDRPVRRRAP